MNRLAIATLALSLYGCARCSDEPAVPFKLNPPPEVPTVDAPAAPDAAVGLITAFPTPADEPSVLGQPLALRGVRTLYEIDLDGDGDRDVLALSADAGQALQLSAFTREPAGLAAARAVPGFVAPDAGACTLADTRFIALSRKKAALRVSLACPGAERPPIASSLWLLALEATPRSYERLDCLAFTSTGEPALALEPRSVDGDADRFDDVAVRVGPREGAQGEALELTWLDRPSGLVRDVREPEATLSAWAAAAQAMIAKRPDAAIERAQLALSFARAVCRELGSAQLALDGAPGVPCGTLPSLGALSTALIGAYARRGDVALAFDEYRTLRHAEPRATQAQLDAAQAALAKLPALPGVTLRHGPAVESVRQPRVHLPSARFVSDATVYLHRIAPVVWNLDTGEEQPAPRSDALVRDPSGQLIAASIDRTCDGLTVRIERAPPSGSDYTTAAPITNALLVPTSSAPGCTPASHRPDAAGFALLGWAPQGLVAARGSEVRLLPMTSGGHAGGEPRVLAPDSPRPAPLPSGSATRDGARYVEATPYGVLVYGPSSRQVELWRPEGYLAIAQGALEAAISPSARRVAVVAGGQVYVLERVH